MFNHPSHTAGS